MTIALSEGKVFEPPHESLTRILAVTVLSGGPGFEREVSLQSGDSVCAALARLGHRVTRCDVQPHQLSALDVPCDIVFIALHGEFGEDGTLQAELDRRGLRYTGSAAAASRLAMDKPNAKRRFLATGLPTPDFLVLSESTLRSHLSRLEPPAVVKPPSSGSSVDTIIARSEGDLEDAASRVVAKYGEALVEKYVRGPELTVGVLGDRALPVCQIRTRREFYDYQAKYVDDDTEYLFDIDLPDSLLQNVREMSLQAHRALGCEVFSRVDWMVDGSTLQPFILEVNTIPGFTTHSLLPKAAARVGLSFDRLCHEIIELSLDRYCETK